MVFMTHNTSSYAKTLCVPSQTATTIDNHNIIQTNVKWTALAAMQGANRSSVIHTPMVPPS